MADQENPTEFLKNEGKGQDRSKVEGACHQDSFETGIEMGAVREVSEVKGQSKTGNVEVKGMDLQRLERLVKDLHVKGDAKEGKALKMELISKLEKGRMEAENREKATRRLAWKEEVKREILRREEVKRKVGFGSLSKVTDGKVKADMSKMSLEARETFKKDRTNFLFHKVFPILYEDLPLESRTEIVTTCRPVSTVWKGSTEACILPTYELPHSNCRSQTTYMSGVQGSHDVRVCMPQFHVKTFPRFIWMLGRGYSGRSPFFSKRLSIQGREVDWKDNLEFWRAAEALLRRWGSEIWVCQIRFDKGMSFEVMYEQLVKFLKLMPNLSKIIIVDHPRRGSNSMLVTDMMRDLGKDIYGPLRARMARNPLPELPHLRSWWSQDCVVAPLVQAAFAKYGGSLAFLVMHDSADGEGDDPMELVFGKDLKLPRLNEVVVSNYASPTAWDDFTVSCPSLEGLQLKQFQLRVGSDALALFQNLNRLRPISTLKRLLLTIQPTSGIPLKLSDGELKSIFLDLPQLEVFWLTVLHLNLKNIDFLLPCVSLKELGLSYLKVKNIMANDMRKEKNKNKKPTAAPPPPPDEVIQFFQYTNRLYESNLWKLFPQLGQVSIRVATTVLLRVGEKAMDLGTENSKVKNYNREGYKKYLYDNRPTN